MGIRGLQENIDTTSSGGRLVFHFFGALAEFERNLVRERTQAGLSAARKRGRQGGRSALLSLTKKALALKLHQERNHTIKEICNMMRISKSTLYNYLNKAGQDGVKAFQLKLCYSCASGWNVCHPKALNGHRRLLQSLHYMGSPPRLCTGRSMIC